VAVRDALLAYAHYLSIIGVFATLSMEAVLLRPRLIVDSGRWLYRVDVAYFVTVVLAVATGFGRACFGIKGWAFYAHSPAFYAKLSLFAVIVLLSLAPARLFRRWQRGFAATAGYEVPAAELARARRGVMLEVHLLSLVPLAAVLMARGIG
jgi:putative membrane protein